jgi:hypothetical protein
MSSNFNNAKIINVYYNKGDRKPYDVNGKPIAYIGQESVGATLATKIRFYLGEQLDSSTAVIVTKRPDGERRLDLCELVPDGVNSYYEVELNAWYGAVKGKATLVFKVYDGEVEFDDEENPTEITSTVGRIVVSDIFNLEIAYAPEADLIVPPDDSLPYQEWFAALSTKLDKAQSIMVKSSPPTSGELAGNALNDRYFYVQTDGVGKLLYVDGSTLIEVVWGIGTLALASNGNEDINVGTNAGKMYWDEDRGTIIAGLYDDQEAGIGDSLFFFGKATEAIAKGEVVQFAGNTGGNIRIKKAVFAEISAQPDLLMGVAKHAIALNDFGYVVSFGYVRNLNTTAFTTPILYLSTSVAGALSSTKPTTGFKGSISAVARPSSVGGNDGFIIVRPNLVKGIGDLADVTITTATSGQILSFDGSKWVNSTRLTTAESDIDSLEGRMTTAEGDIDSLEGRMTTAEGDIDDIEDGTTIVPKALADQNGNVINTTYLTQSSATATYIPLSQKGQANGVVPLGSNGKVPSIYLSGEQDDIQEFDTLEDFPLVGEADILYVAIDTNKLYRWGGSAYVVISETLALGTTNTTAFAGDRGLALETLTDNIVDGSQALALKDQVIRNTVVGTSPLVVNSIASTTANLTEFQVNGAKKLEVTPAGGLNQNGERLFTQPVDNTNTFFGALSGKGDLTTGAFNTGFGRSSLELLTSGQFNTGVGRISLGALTTGNSNSSFGLNSGLAITTGSENTFVGTNSGNTGAWGTQLATATNSTAIGSSAFTDKSNQMVFGNASVTEILLGRGLANVGIGTTSPSARLTVSTTASGFFDPLLKVEALTNPSYAIIQIDRPANTRVSAVKLSTLGTQEWNIGQLYNDGSANNGFSISTNETLSNAKLHITDSGNVGIGTASPAVALQISTLWGVSSDGITQWGVSRNQGVLTWDTNKVIIGGLLSNALELRSNNTARMFIDTTGNVGIGTTSPNAKLHIIGSGTTESLIETTGTSGNIYAAVSFKNSARSFGLGIGGTSETGFGVANKLYLFNSNTASMSLVVDGSGNVGIGTTAPATLLHTLSTTNNFTTIESSSTGNHFIGVVLKTATKAYELAVGANGSASTFANKFYIWDATSSVSRLTIDTNGLVGINETAPSAQLQVKSGATTRVPLIVDTLASHNAQLQEWRLNGTQKARVDVDGNFVTNGVFNVAGSANSYIILANEGTEIRRNIADTNPALIVNLANASATGNIQVWQKEGTALATITNSGGAVLNNTLEVKAPSDATNQRWSFGPQPTAYFLDLKQTVSAGNVRWNFSQRNNSADFNNVLVLNTGNVGINTIDPTVRFEVNGLAKFDGTPSNAQTDDYTLVLADKGKVLRINSSSNRTVTIPLNSSVAFPIDTEIAILRYGTGTVSISPTSGVTLQSKNAERKISGQYGSVALKKIGENEWVLVGSLEA